MERVRRFLQAGVTCFVDLTGIAELPSYEPLLPMETADGRRIEYLREPIPDHGVPASRGAWRISWPPWKVPSTPDTSSTCTAAPASGAAPRWPAAGSRTAGSRTDPLEELQRRWSQCAKSSYWPMVPETSEQIEFVRGWRSQRAGGRRAPSPIAPDARARVRGALLGLAAGDAAGSAFSAGTPAEGSWSQHTALALCLAESLIERGAFHPRDQIERYMRWQRDGHLSATGRASPATPDIFKALANYRWRGQPMAGPHDPRDRSTAGLPRVVAAVSWASADPAEAVHLAGECARTTHQSPFVVDACRFFGAMLVGALRGASPDDIRKGLYEPVAGLWTARPLKPSVATAFRAAGRSKPGAATGTGCQADAVRAVLRARAVLAPGFDETVRQACEDAIEPALEAALAGALHGASYGADSIPADRLSRLARLDLLESFASRLAKAGATATVSGRRA